MDNSSVFIYLIILFNSYFLVSHQIMDLHSYMKYSIGIVNVNDFNIITFSYPNTLDIVM